MHRARLGKVLNQSVCSGGKVVGSRLSYDQAGFLKLETGWLDPDMIHKVLSDLKYCI